MSGMSDTGASNADACSRIGGVGVRRSPSSSISSQSSQEDLSPIATGTSVSSKQLDATTKSDITVAERQDNGQYCIPIECAVCLQTCVHPVKLPCSHIFCYLCVKGVAFQSKRCAMCRQEIPSDFLIHPQLIDRTQLEKENSLDDGYQWFYEGRNGWWQYDERTSSELEMAYKRSQRLCELLIAGFLYIIDFDQMLQYRKSEPTRRRRIKRDLSSIPKKGVAGLRLEQNEDNHGDDSESSTLDLLSVAASRAALNANHCLSPSQTPQVPSNTPQTPQTPRSPPSPAPEHSVDGQGQDRWEERERRRLRRAMEEIEHLRLHDEESLTPPSLEHMAVYYNIEDPDIDDNSNLWQSDEGTSEDDGNIH